MMFSRLSLAVPLACLLAAPLPAQDLAAYESADRAAVGIWNQMPLTLRNAGFVTEEAGGYGLNTPRDGAVFAPGEPLLVYAEPLGYGWRQNDDSTFTFGLSVDLVLRDPSGTVLGSQDDFQRAEITSNRQNREFFVTLTLNLTNAPVGDYILEYIVHDQITEKSATMSFPFTIAAP